MEETAHALPDASLDAAHAVAEHGGFLQDTHSWVLFSALLFVAVIWKVGRRPLLNALDARTAKIRADLEEAERLKNEAQKLLADYQQKHKDAVTTAQKIIENAQESVALMQRDAEAKLKENLERREELLLERIARAEKAAVQELRHQAADIAAKAAESLLADAMGKTGAKLVDDAISELPSSVN